MNSGYLSGATTQLGSGDIAYVGGRNAFTTTIVAGSFVCWDLESGNQDGIGFHLPTTTNIAAFAGVLTESVPSGAYTRRILARAYYASALVNGNVTCAAGSQLQLVAGDAARNYYTTPVGTARPLPVLI